MTRKTAPSRWSTAGAVLFVLVLVAFFVPMPFVVMSPGLTENTLGKSSTASKVI